MKTMMMMSMLFFTGVMSVPMYDDVVDYNTDYFYDEHEVDIVFVPDCENSYNSANCTQCKDVVNRLKNETGTLIKIVNDIDLVCERIYGPAAKECVNVTNVLKKDLEHLEHTNATSLCKQWHYC